MNLDLDQDHRRCPQEPGLIAREDFCAMCLNTLEEAPGNLPGDFLTSGKDTACSFQIEFSQIASSLSVCHDFGFSEMSTFWSSQVMSPHHSGQISQRPRQTVLSGYFIDVRF